MLTETHLSVYEIAECTTDSATKNALRLVRTCTMFLKKNLSVVCANEIYVNWSLHDERIVHTDSRS